MQTLTPERVARRLVGHHILQTPMGEGPEALRACLAQLRCIQLDPLDPMGTNADLVAAARVDGLGAGDVYRHLLPGHAFEHFAKERCLLPASAFPHYRSGLAQTPWWRHSERMKRIEPGVLEAIEAELRARGPSTVAELTDHGRVEPLDYNGWKGTSRMTSLAMEVLWVRCRVVVAERTRAGKRWAVPEHVLPEHHDLPAPKSPRAFARWGLLERVEACGLLPTAGGPWWSSLAAWRSTDLPDQLIAEGLLRRVRVSGSRRTFLCAADWLDRPMREPDERMRILGPLDPLLWDRKLVHHAFGFEYLWEVYKPAAKRRWGYYVCPLLHRGRLVGRVEGRRGADGGLEVVQLWREGDFDDTAWEQVCARHDAFLRRGSVGTSPAA